jgi:hypothetical protein
VTIARLTASALTVMAALAGCNTDTVGHPRAAEIPTSPISAESEEPDYSLARLCELLSPEEAQQLGGSAEGEEGNSLRDGHDICMWADETTLVVGFQQTATTAQADTGPAITNTPTTIDGLPAVQQLNTDTVVSCQLLVDLPSGRMVHALVGVRTAGEGKYDHCRVATDLANLIVPRVRDQ